MLRSKGSSGPCLMDGPPRLPPPKLEGIRRRFDLGLASTGLLYSCPSEELVRSLRERFPDHRLERLDLQSMSADLDIDKPGFVRLHQRAESLSSQRALILIHGYCAAALPHCILLFDYLERESPLTKALAASGSFLVVAWTAPEKERFLEERLSLPGADGGYRDFSFVMHSFARADET